IEGQMPGTEAAPLARSARQLVDVERPPLDGQRVGEGQVRQVRTEARLEAPFVGPEAEPLDVEMPCRETKGPGRLACPRHRQLDVLGPEVAAGGEARERVSASCTQREILETQI